MSPDIAFLNAGLRSVLRWCVRAVVAAVVLVVWLAPGVLFFGLTGHSSLQGITLLDATPWAGWLWLAYVVTLPLGLTALYRVWRTDAVLVAGMVMAFLALPFSFFGVASSEKLWTWLNAQQVQALAEHRSLVLAHYSTTSSFKGSRTTSHWVDISHPLSPGQVLKLPHHQVPSALTRPGLLLCTTVKTGRWGWRWVEAFRPCPVADATQPQPGWGLTILQVQLLDRMPWQMGSAGPEGHFDEQGRAWWFRSDSLRPSLAPAGAGEAPPLSGSCSLWGESRLSTDKRAVLGYMNRSAVGQAEPPPLPHWETLGRNVWVQRVEADGQCASVGMLLHPGWVLDVDFDHASQRLAVFSAHRATDAEAATQDPEALAYRVTLYTFDAQRKAHLEREQVLAPEPLWRPFPRQAKLHWAAGGLVLKHPNTMLPSRVILTGVPSVQLGLGSQAQQPSAVPPLPAVLAPLAFSTWKLSAQAPRAPVQIYTHPDYDGALLLHYARGQWFHVSPLSLPPPEADADVPKPANVEPDVIDFSHLKLELSPDGHRLMACGGRYFIGGPSRCVLLSLPWPD